ncbi:glycosyltransferase family protein [Thermotalea metallivorans]|uniref:Spore protein YkvP n=1 Tax=Thermotalea metallivorans TaxID=520762 RepID=A0A140L2B6_9FIRM|nr:glycosyltransferase [Thermotalea metallivorans]KXG74691.1 Spore protein YkvP [Thermotalea metallivorans]
MLPIINKKTGLPVKAASILDKFGDEWFQYECRLIPLPTSFWKEILIAEKPDLLLVQSAWQGNNGQWRYRITDLHLKEKDLALRNIVRWCKQHHIPTVFWNIEDPYHFEHFIDAAKEFDYIFTTDGNSIPRYMDIVSHHRVFLLPFGAQPKIHNPIDKDKGKLGSVGFSGTWHCIGHEARKRDMEIILKPALPYGVHIYDRMYHYHQDDNYKFPDIYQPYIRGTVPYEQIGSVYKKYHVFLNVNTIQDSPTMFSCRIFELLACGINVISGYALGIDKMFPGIVKLCKNEEDTVRNLELLLNNKELRDRIALLGLREVLNKHTYRQRLCTILDHIGIGHMGKDKPGITCITSTNRQEFMDNVFENYQRQRYENKELIVVLNNHRMNIDLWMGKARQYEQVRIYSVDEGEPLGVCLNYAISQSKYDYIAKMDDDDYYGPEYIGDLMNAFQYTDADIVGKHAYYVYFHGSKTLALKFAEYENCYVNLIAGSTITAKKHVFQKVPFVTDRRAGADTQFLLDCKKNGFKIYSTDRFNFCACRRPRVEEHTFQIDEEEYLRKCQVVGYLDDFITHVTV